MPSILEGRDPFENDFLSGRDPFEDDDALIASRDPFEASQDSAFVRRIDDLMRGALRLSSTFDTLSIDDAAQALRGFELVDQMGLTERDDPLNLDPSAFSNYQKDVPALQNNLAVAYRLAPSEQKADIKKRAVKTFSDNIYDLASKNTLISGLPPSPAVEKFTSAPTFKEGIGAFLEAPMEISSSVGLESLAQFAPAVPLLFTGTVPAVAGVGATSFANEYAGDIVNSLAEAGVDIENPEAIREAFSDARLMAEWRDHATKRAVPIAILDAVSAGVGGQLIETAKTPLKKTLASAIEGLAIQPGLGGGGEVLGSLAAGDEIQPGAVLAEIVGEIPGGAAETAAGAYRASLGRTAAPILKAESVDEAIAASEEILNTDEALDQQLESAAFPEEIDIGATPLPEAPTEGADLDPDPEVQDDFVNLGPQKDQAKQAINKLLESGEVAQTDSFRGTSIDELQEIVNTGQLQTGRDFEGVPGISATLIRDGQFPVYGDGSGIIIPESQTEASGRASETLINENTDPKTLKYVIDGEVLTYDQLQDRLDATKGRDPFEDDLLLSQELGFYSGLSKAVSNLKQESGTAEQFFNAIKKQPGVKAEELEWTGIEEYIKAKQQEGQKVTKQEIQDFVDSNGVQVEEVVKGDDIDIRVVEDTKDPEYPFAIMINDKEMNRVKTKAVAEREAAFIRGDPVTAREYGLRGKGTKFSDYQLQGGENYREVLLKLPDQKIKKPYTQWLKENFTGEDTKEARELYSIQLEPGTAGYKSSHFDEPNILAHVRLNDRTGFNGEKVLFVEEIQSDWGAEARKKGFVTAEAKNKYKADLEKQEAARKVNSDILKEEERVRELDGIEYKLDKRGKISFDDGSVLAKISEEYVSNEIQRNAVAKARAEARRRGGTYKDYLEESIAIVKSGSEDLYRKRFEDFSKERVKNFKEGFEQQIKQTDDYKNFIGQSKKWIPWERSIFGPLSIKGTPMAPFVGSTNSWAELAAKRILRIASEEGYDSVSWTTGEQQAERYDLSEKVEAIGYRKHGDEYELEITDKNLNEINLPKSRYKADELDSVVGKEIAEKIVNGEGETNIYGTTLSGVDLKVGGEGMKGFYDRTLPNIFKKVARKLDKSATVSTEIIPDIGEVFNVKLTDTAKESALKGQPLFMQGSGKGITTRQLKPVLDRFVERYPGVKDGLRVVSETQKEAVARISGQMQKGLYKKQKIGRIKGQYDPRTNTLFLVPENISSDQDALYVIQHELIVHKGLGFLPEKERIQLIKSIAENAPKSEALKKQWANIEKNYQGRSDHLKAEELLTSFAERNLSKPDQFLNKIIRQIQRILIKMGLMKPGLRKSELIDQIYQFAQAFADGKKAQRREPKEARMSQSAFGSNYMRVMPRDLFNEAKVLSMHLKLVDDYNKGNLPKGFKVNLNEESLSVGLTQDGEMYLEGVEVYFNGNPVQLNVSYNAGKTNRFPLYVTSQEMDVWAETVYDESGNLEKDFTDAFGEETAEPNQKIQLDGTWDLANSFLNQLGVIGLWDADRMLPDNFEFDLFDPEQGFQITETEDGYTAANLNASLNGEPVEFYMGFRDEKLRFRQGESEGLVLSDRRSMSPEFKEFLDGEEIPNLLLSQEQPFDQWVAPNAALGIISDELKTSEGIKQRLRFTRKKLQDKHIAWRDVQEQIDKKGGTLSDFSDAYNKFTLVDGKVGAKFRFLAEKHVEPLVDAISKSTVTMDDLGRYMYAKFAPQRNARIAKINPDFPDGGSGLTNKQAQAVLNKFTPEQVQELEPMAQRVYAMERYKLDELVKAGRITQELRNELGKDDRYVPLKGFEDPANLVADTVATGKGFDQAQDIFKRAGGRSTLAGEILSTALRDIEAAVFSAEENRVGQSVLKLVLENPNKNLWEVNPIKVQKSVNKRTGQIEQRVLKDYKALARDPNVFVTWVKGQPYAIEFKDNPTGESALARSLKNMGVDSVPWYVRYLAGLNRYLSYMNTALSPEFILTNPIRDVQTALAKTYGDYDAKTAKQVGKNLPRAFRAAMSSLATGKIGQAGAKTLKVTEAEKQFAKEFHEEGGKVDYFRTKSVDEMRKSLDNELKAAAKGKTGAAIRAFRHAYHLVENGNAVMENSTRISLYITLREQGVSKHKAAVAAKNLTVNFARKGEAGVLINSLYLFYNASLQGAHLTLRLMKNPKVQRLMVKAGVAMAVLTQYNILAGGEDDDGESNYFKIQDYEKERNLIFMWPDGSGRYTKIPLPYGLNVPLNVGTALAHMANGQDPAKEMAWLAGAAWNSFSPVGENGWNIIAPTVFDPFVDISLNRNFADSPIMPERNPYEKTPTPDSQLAFYSTSPAYKKIAETVNALTGGDKQKAGYVDVSPESIQHLVNHYTGASGGFINRVANSLSDPDMPMSRQPFVRKFYGEKSPYSINDRYYRNKEHIFYLEDRMDYLKALRGSEDRKYYVKWRNENRQGIALLASLKATEKGLRSQYSLRKKARERGSTDQEKQIDKRIEQIKIRFNKRYNDALLDEGLSEELEKLLKLD